MHLLRVNVNWFGTCVSYLSGDSSYFLNEDDSSIGNISYEIHVIVNYIAYIALSHQFNL